MSNPEHELPQDMPDDVYSELSAANLYDWITHRIEAKNPDPAREEPEITEPLETDGPDLPAA